MVSHCGRWCVTVCNAPADSEGPIVTQRAYEQSVEIDWAKAMKTGHLSRYIQRHDRDDDGDGGAAGGGGGEDGEDETELQEVKHQLAARGESAVSQQCGGRGLLGRTSTRSGWCADVSEVSRRAAPSTWHTIAISRPGCRA